MNGVELANWFRQASPYINSHRHKNFVIMLDGDCIASKNFMQIINDICILHSLGIGLVLVFGARLQIDERLNKLGIKTQIHNNIRVTDPKSFEVINEIVGKIQLDLMAKISSRLNGGKAGNGNVICGNFVLARPIGVSDGVDFQHSGIVRRVDIDGIKSELKRKSIVLISPLGVSLTGESFNLPLSDLSAEIAINLKASKLIGFAENSILDHNNEVVADLFPTEAEQYLSDKRFSKTQIRFLKAAIKAGSNGVERSHLLSFTQDGSLLHELFSRAGVGTQVAEQTSQIIRKATSNDIVGIIKLISPLEEQGILIKRTRSELEMNIDNYIVVECDGEVIGCASVDLYPSDNTAEMGCFVVHPDYRKSNLGDRLFDFVQKQIKLNQIDNMFVLTTQTSHWFLERGFVAAEVEDLPLAKAKKYNYQRKSKIFIKII